MTKAKFIREWISFNASLNNHSDVKKYPAAHFSAHSHNSLPSLTSLLIPFNLTNCVWRNQCHFRFFSFFINSVLTLTSFDTLHDKKHFALHIFQVQNFDFTTDHKLTLDFTTNNNSIHLKSHIRCLLSISQTTTTPLMPHIILLEITQAVTIPV